MMEHPSVDGSQPSIEQFIKQIKQVAIAFWVRWIEPVATLEDETRRSKARFVSISLICMGILSGVILPLRYLLLPIDDKKLERILLSLVSAFILFSLQRVVQRGYYRFGVLVCVFMATSVISASSIVLDHQGDTFYYFLIVLVFVSVIMSLRYVSAIIIFHTLIMLFTTSISSPEKAEEILRWPLPNYVIIASILMIFLAQRSYLERKTRQRIQESENRYRKVSELVSDYAYSICRDANGQPYVEWITDSFERLTGYSSEFSRSTLDMSGKVTFPDDIQTLRDALDEAFEGKTTVCEIRYYKPDGKVGWLEITRKPEFDPKTGQVIRVYGVGKEITSLKHAKEQEELIAQQEGRIHLTQEFVHAISHDFRTSLSNIETNRYLIQRKTQDAGNNQTLTSHLATIELYVKRMSVQLDGLTDIANLSDMNLSPSPLAFLLDQIEVAYRSVAVAHEISLVLKPCDRNVILNMDAAKIQLAIRSLLDNALTYTEPNGCITLEATCNEDTVSIAITDDGEGIDAEHIPQIFDLFYRVDPARNVHKGGVGVGLSLVRFVAEAHHGTVKVTSEPGKGSTFTLEIPYVPELRLPQKIKNSGVFTDAYDHLRKRDMLPQQIG